MGSIGGGGRAIYAVDELEARSKCGVVENRRSGFRWDGSEALSDLRMAPPDVLVSAGSSEAFVLPRDGGILFSSGDEGGRFDEDILPSTNLKKTVSAEVLW
jgi:hypothetical protein